MRRVLLRRRARRGRGLGEVDPASTRGRAHEFESFFGRSDTFALGVCNGCQMMAALRELVPGAADWPRFRAQPLRAVRGALGDGRGDREPVDPLRRHGRQPDADRDRAWRGPGGVREPGSAERRALAVFALRRQSRCADADLSAQSQRLAGGITGPDHARRPLHDRDAAPGARVPRRRNAPGAGRLAARRARGCGCSATRASGSGEIQRGRRARSRLEAKRNGGREPRLAVLRASSRATRPWPSRADRRRCARTPAPACAR